MPVLIKLPLATAAVLTLYAAHSWSAFASATSTIVYKEYFHSKSVDSAIAPWQLRQATPRITRSPRGIKHLGLFKTNDTLLLTLSNLPAHQRITVEFGFHIIGSWDGVTDDDRFKCLVDWQPLIDESFSNTTSSQSWPAASPGMLYPPRATARNSNMLAYPSKVADDYVGPMDATYVTTKSIEHDRHDIVVAFSSALNNINQGMEFKGWGLEYVVVYANDTITNVADSSVHFDPPRPSPIAAYTGRDIREIAEFCQDDDFPGIKAGSDFERSLHITTISCECHSCGDFCLWYIYRCYTDGWVNVWSNKPAKGQSLFSALINTQELDSVRTLISQCLEYGIEREYHDTVYEEEHPELTHCVLTLKMSRREAYTEVYAAEPASLRSLMDYLLNVLSRYGWTPSPG